MIVEITRKGLFEEMIDAGEKGGERLAGAGRRGNQYISARLNGRPSLNLDIGGDADVRMEPLGNEGMKSGGGHGNEMLPRHSWVFYQEKKGQRDGRI